ncbi:hypothetical protein HIM_03078 [Hirsutella minnesotensis 3608]|nr:hypothetical protein HIM_03078 [Hirsutella minnesotensis 3608]
MNSTVNLCAIPAGVSPTGIHNFVDPPSLGPAVLAVGVVLAVISTAFTIGRLYINRNKLHSADYFTFIACVTNVAYTGVICAQYRYYRHSWDIPVCWYTGNYLRLPFVQTVLFSPAFFFSKAAIFLLYRQLFAVGRRFKMAVHIGLGITFLLYLSNIPLAAIYAAPRIGHSWESLLETIAANSRSFALGGIVQSAVGTLMDFYMFFLPLPILIRLQMPLGRRLQLVGVFSTALLAVAASVVSLVFKIEILSSTDSAWLAALTSMCSLIETNVAIVVGCMPACAHLLTPPKGGSTFFKSLRSRLLGSSGRGVSSKQSESSEKAPKLGTFGATQDPRRMKYYELTDTALLGTQTTRHDDALDQSPASKANSSRSIRTTEHMCAALATLLGADKVMLPGSTGYEASLSSYFTPQASAVRPLCFVAPQTAAEVSTVVKTLTSSGECGCIAVRSGGHTWFPSASNSPGGVTVDLRGLNSVHVSADGSSVSVGSGATWDAVYAKLDPLGLSVAGGRVAGVGVGGLTLGGGISYFGPRQGWTCNQATSFEVVLADGSVVQASGEHNSDLWRGLRGGANNLGIVTRVNLTTFEQGLLWSSLTLSPLEVVDDQAKIYARLMAADGYDENASFLTGWAFSAAQGQSVILNQLVYTKPVDDENPTFYQDVLSLPRIHHAVATTTLANMTTLARKSVKLQPPQAARYLTATTTFVPTEAMIRATYDAFNASLQSLQDVKGLMWAVNLEPLPPQIYARGAADNTLGLTDRQGSLVVCLLSPSWPDQAHDEQVYAAARSLMEDIEDRAKILGVYDPYIYLNYAAPWQEVIASYGKESVRSLRELRARVDPHDFFTNSVVGGFKIRAPNSADH